jgi:nitroimidazol reductase NimA-like FMN-containing flavoprotein (pyridoxamine 5'-phosphate oxidase superfamily)
MKQHISVEQFKSTDERIIEKIVKDIYEDTENETLYFSERHITFLDSENKSYFRVLIKNITELIDIGKMIEILKKHYKDEWTNVIFYATMHGDVYERENNELCDALWEAVKYVLEVEE